MIQQQNDAWQCPLSLPPVNAPAKEQPELPQEDESCGSEEAKKTTMPPETPAAKAEDDFQWMSLL